MDIPLRGYIVFMTRMRPLVLLLVLPPSLASAEFDCIVLTRDEGYDASRPGAEVGEDHQWQVASLQALDYAALAALL